MQNQEKETYKDYLVRKVTEEIGKVFEEKMDQAKKELKEIQYEDVLNKTEEILKNYKKLSEHIVLTDKEKETLKDETSEFHNKELESIMTGLFSEDELYLESLLKSKYQTKLFIDFINRVINNYLNGETQDKVETRKRNILKELYIKGQKQSEFIYNNYEVERTFYLDKDKLIKDLAPYFFRYQRTQYIKLD
ncbi:MAG TPA: hypothetical protein DCZ30_05860 [Clostridiales bacterium]|nr:hypothetical protein [Clostridiales bacterium]